MQRLDASALGAVPETLLIPLAARMIASDRYPELGFRDPEARRIGERIGFDPARFSGDVGSMRGSVARALWFDRIVSAFVAANPGGLCVSIGSGLDDRPARIGLPAQGIDWIDVEFAEVIGLRENVIARRANVRGLAVDDADPEGWLAALPWTPGRPALVLAEGVLMYFSPDDGERLLRRLAAAARQQAASLDLLADFATPIMVRNSRRHPSLSAMRARFTWGVGRPEDISAMVPGLQLIELGDIARQSGVMARTMSIIYRLCTGRPVYFAAHYRLPAGV